MCVSVLRACRWKKENGSACLSVCGLSRPPHSTSTIFRKPSQRRCWVHTAPRTSPRPLTCDPAPTDDPCTGALPHLSLPSCPPPYPAGIPTSPLHRPAPVPRLPWGGSSGDRRVKRCRPPRGPGPRECRCAGGPCETYS